MVKAIGITFFALAGIAGIAGCLWLFFVVNFYPWATQAPGWTCDRTNCTPNAGDWQGLRVGMSRDDAFRAVCSLWKRGVIAKPTVDEEQEDVTPSELPVHMEGQECKPNPYELSLKPAKQMADPSGSMDLWHLFTPNMWCAFHLRHQRVWVDFDKDLRVRSIRSHCYQLII